jgi:hypothetical protein
MKSRAILDALRAFYPTITTVVVLPAVILLGYPWIGIPIFAVVLCLRKTWWTCVFGLMNTVVLCGGILACLIPYIHIARKVLSG